MPTGRYWCFTALLAGGMTALCWSRRPGVVACGGAGLLLAPDEAVATARGGWA